MRTLSDINHRDTKTRRRVNLCVSVSQWLMVSVSSRSLRVESLS